MAALEVVKKRLDEVGLGEFCLELHSTKANKKDVLESLRTRLEHRPSLAPAALERSIEEYERHRRHLSRYVDLLNHPFGQSGKSLQQLFWGGIQATARVQELGLPTGPADIGLVDALTLTPIDLDRRRTALEVLEQLRASLVQTYGGPHHHPWAGIHRMELSPFEQEALLRALETWRQTMLGLEKVVMQAAEVLAIPELDTFDAARSVMEAAALLPEDSGEIILDLLPKLKSEDTLNTLDKFVHMVRRVQQLLSSLRANFEGGGESLPRAVVLRDLETIRCKLTVGGAVFAGQVRELPPLAKRYREIAQLTEAKITSASRLFQTAGWCITLTAYNLATMMDAIHLLRSTPRKCLLIRSAAIIDEAMRPVLEQAAERARVLTEQQRRLVEYFTFAPDYSIPKYRRWAAALRRAGRLQRLAVKTPVLRWLADKEFTDAWRMWLGGSKARAMLRRQEMAQRFEELADYLEAGQSFQNGCQLQELCGEMFQGLATDFEGLLMVNAFARQVSRTFPESTSAHREARRFLLEGDLAILDATLAKADEPTITDFRMLLSALTGENADAPPEIEFDAMHRAYLQVAETAEHLYHTLKELGLKDEFPTKRLSTLADEIERLAKLKEDCEDNAAIKELLGPRFRGIDTDLSSLKRRIQLVCDLRAAKLPQRVLDSLLRADLGQILGRLTELTALLRAGTEGEQMARAKAMETSGLDCQMFFGADSLEETPLATLVTRIDRALTAGDELPVWLEYLQARAEVEEMGLSSILKVYEAANAPCMHLVAALAYVFHRTILDQAYKRYPEVRRLAGTSLETARRRFQELDRAIIEAKRRHLAAALACVPLTKGRNWGPRREWTELYLIHHERGKKKQHFPVRDLLRRAGTVIQQMKPCWMMSPASIAQFIRPDGIEFDLVVIDEASQMRPEEALGAIGRGR